MSTTSLENPKGLVRKKELLKIVPIGLRTLDTLIARRAIPFIKINRVVLFSPSDVLKELRKYERKIYSLERKAGESQTYL